MRGMFRLKLATDPRWANLAACTLDEILSDHAYCEQKAASSCISLIQRYPERQELVEALAPVVAEEWEHFRMVLAEQKKRGFKLGPQRRDAYVNRLRLLIRKGKADKQMLDELLICALIEARSCERFRVLSEQLSDVQLRRFYRHFMKSEAGHYTLFMKLALRYFSKDEVRQRWRELVQAEKEILENMELRGDRMH
ncbi:MAG: tRNA-(ms[2]io[6]A)-hydroxylase [Chitinophagales bacterium]|nr:tRNA-(ms[2]io[6]A)-hydroxylase [Chitinophagales bacterium]MDW8428554.1 tRNA-(ms[2]io[6]A)-hydroxylase [Chitinophagales bacterium]